MKERMLICKSFQSMKQAENYQDSLYNKYDRVRLIEFPMFGEYGMYKWEVCAVALCGCTRFSYGEVECYEVEAFNHDYVVFENPKSGSITAVHSEDCKCKTNK